MSWYIRYVLYAIGPIHRLHFCHHSNSFEVPIRPVPREPRWMLVNVNWLSHFIYSVVQLPFNDKWFQVAIKIGLIQNSYCFMSTFHKSIHEPLLQTNFSMIFSFQALDRMARSLATSQWPMYIIPLSHFGFYMKWMIRCTACSPTHWEDFSLPVAVQDHP